LKAVACSDTKGMSTWKQFYECSSYRSHGYLSGWGDSDAIAHHFLCEHFLRDSFKVNDRPIEGCKNVYLSHYSPAISALCSEPSSALRSFRMRFMRRAIRSDCVPITTCAILPCLITPEAPRLLRRGSSTWPGSLTKRRSRVMHPSTLCTLVLPPRASSTCAANMSSRSSVTVATP